MRLSNKYENAERILREEGLNISGRKLLETINFLYVAEMVPTTLPNIVKSYSTDPEQYHNYQVILKKLDILTEAKVLLDTNKMYRITSDIEQRLLDEMKGYTVQQFVKKNRAVKAYKSSSFVSQLSRVNDNGLQYSFYITTENDDELTSPPMKQLKIKIKTLYSFDDRSTEVENLKMQHQNDKDLMWIVPDNKDFRELDKLIDEVERIGYLEERYTDPNSEEGRIMLNFLASKAEKENRINKLIDEALINSIAVYLYNTFQLNDENWQTTLQAQQRQIIQNVFTNGCHHNWTKR